MLDKTSTKENKKLNVLNLLEVWNLALLASPTEKLDAARYFESIADHKQYDKAVILYQKVTLLFM